MTWPHDKMLVYVGIWRGNERMAVKTGTKDDGGRLLAAAIPVAADRPPGDGRPSATSPARWPSR